MSAAAPATWLRPVWPAPAGVRALCSSREGGVSQGPYASLNLGDHVGDDAAAVATNRARFAAALAARPVFLQQVHGTQVALLTARSPDGMQADACWTDQPGVACTVMVADCLPVLLADDQGRVVGAAHCGWRGLLGTAGSGAIEALWQAMAPRIATDPYEAPARAMAWLGPCIGPAAFEVGGEVRDAFLADRADAARHFVPAGAGKWLADLPALARDRLQALGIGRVAGNDGNAAWCTVSDASRFFSHRRDRVSGRLAAAVWIA